MQLQVRLAVAASFTLLASACSTTSTVHQTSALADAGIAYGTAASEVVELARVQIIESDSRKLLAELPDNEACTPAELANRAAAGDGCKDSIDNFADSQKAASVVWNATSTLKAHAAALAAYFTALKALAAEDTNTAAATALTSLGTDINALGAVLEVKNPLTEAQISAYSKLGGFLADAYKGKVIREALSRDAATISRALAVQEQSLEYCIGRLEAIAAGKAETTYLRSVERPYLLKNIADPDAWVLARRNTLFAANLPTEVQTVRTASQRMQVVWDDILNNRASSEDFVAVISDMNRLLALLVEVRNANANANAEPDEKP